ncbi:MAG: GAF domain-containing sensor histidine kinase [bacterium]
MTEISNMFYHLLDSQQSVFIEDLSTPNGDIRPEVALLYGYDIKSLVLTPVSSDDHLIGILAIRDPELPKSKILENIQLVEVIVGMLSNLLSREAALNMLEDRVAERTQQLSAFFDMAMLAGESEQIADIMQPALVKIMEISSSEAAIIHLLSEENRIMQLVAQRGIDEQTLSQIQKVKMDSTLMEWMSRGSDDIWSSGSSDLSMVLELPNFQSASHISLRARGKIQGILSCYRSAPTPYNPYQVFFLNAIGEQLGLAVENYRLRLEVEEGATIKERQRLARELHDAVSQSLYSLTLFARSGRDAYEAGDNTKLFQSLEQVEMNSLMALKEMRLLLYQLRSLALEEGGLKQAIETRYNLVERRSGIKADVTLDDRLELNTHAEQELFLLTTEALNNAIKHARASQVSVSIRSEIGQLVLEVWDNGQGFDPSQNYAGMGLQNMRQRASVLGGYMNIYSQPGHGTSIRVEIPQLQNVVRGG